MICIYCHTPLHYVAYCGYNLLIRDMLGKSPGLNIDIENADRETPLTLAIKRGYYNTMKTLMANKSTIPEFRKKDLENIARSRKALGRAPRASGMGGGKPGERVSSEVSSGNNLVEKRRKFLQGIGQDIEEGEE